MSEARHRQWVGERIVGESRLDATRRQECELICSWSYKALSRCRSEVTTLVVRDCVLIPATGLQAVDSDREGEISLIRQPVSFPHRFPGAFDKTYAGSG